MNNQPFFSILIANYNNANFIEEALDSVYKQSYTNWEIIIIDDDSTDNSQQIYNTITDSRVKLHYNKRNKGVAYTKHRCIELAEGEICAFLDPDDTLAPEALEKMFHAFQTNENLVVCFSNFCVCNVDMSEQTPYVYPTMPIADVFMVGLVPNHFMSFKRWAYIKTSGINLQLPKAIDRDLVLKLEEVGEVKHIEDYLYYYRINSNSISNNDNMYIAGYWAWECRYRACERRGLEKSKMYDMVNRFLMLEQGGGYDAKKSIEFRIGYIILKPLRWVKYLFQ